MTSVLVDEIESSVVDGADHLLRTAGFCPPPSAHILAEGTDQPYVGFISCRPFYRGADAAAAITDLGPLPSVLAATRLVVNWEDCDLRTALQVPGDTFPTAIVTLDADRTDHTLVSTRSKRSTLLAEARTRATENDARQADPRDQTRRESDERQERELQEHSRDEGLER